MQIWSDLNRLDWQTSAPVFLIILKLLLLQILLSYSGLKTQEMS